jgi:hypothetical protein
MNKLYSKGLMAGLLGVAVATGFAAGQANADQPRMHDAMKNLRQARADLVAATNDKGGHRAAALRHVDAAIAQVDRGIRYDRRH